MAWTEYIVGFWWKEILGKHGQMQCRLHYDESYVKRRNKQTYKVNNKIRYTTQTHKITITCMADR